MLTMHMVFLVVANIHVGHLIIGFGARLSRRLSTQTFTLVIALFETCVIFSSGPFLNSNINLVL